MNDIFVLNPSDLPSLYRGGSQQKRVLTHLGSRIFLSFFYFLTPSIAGENAQKEKHFTQRRLQEVETVTFQRTGAHFFMPLWIWPRTKRCLASGWPDWSENHETFCYFSDKFTKLAENLSGLFFSCLQESALWIAPFASLPLTAENFTRACCIHQPKLVLVWVSTLLVLVIWGRSTQKVSIRPEKKTSSNRKTWMAADQLFSFWQVFFVPFLSFSNRKVFTVGRIGITLCLVAILLIKQNVSGELLLSVTANFYILTSRLNQD